jgi:putative proteasome-type protease
MTYCVALRLDRGLVFAADTRTSAGNDNVGHYRKLHYWRRIGDRVIIMAAAGNLAITQSVISIVNEQLDELSGASESLFTVPSLYRAARLVGSALREVRQLDGPSLEAAAAGFKRLIPAWRSDRLGITATIPHLSGGQLHRGDQRYALLPDW